MIKRLTQHGNSSAIVIAKPILDLLNIRADTPLEVTTDGRNLIISPVKDAKKHQKIQAALKTVNERHGKTLRRLAQ